MISPSRTDKSEMYMCVRGEGSLCLAKVKNNSAVSYNPVRKSGKIIDLGQYFFIGL